MRTENFSSHASPAARIRARWTRALRVVLEQAPAVRWLAAVGVLAALGAIFYVATLPAAGKYLSGGKQYSSDEIARITRSLDAQQIEYRVVDGRIGVSSDRLDAATEVLSKLDLGPHSIAEIRKKSQVPGFLKSLETVMEKERRELQAREEILETMIGNLDGIVTNYVTINRPRTRPGVRSPSSATAFVWLETDGDHKVSPETVQSIQNIIVANEPDVKTDAVTVCDKKGRFYLHAGNPAVGAMSRTRAREEELRQRILERLDWIKGVGVTVQLVHAPAPAPEAPAVVEPPAPAEPKVGVNHGLEIGPEPRPAAPTPPPAALPALPAPPEKDLAKVWVEVPRSFYYKAIPNRNPSAEDLQPIVTQTKALIRTAVGYVVPPDETGEPVKIDTIPDAIALSNPLEAPALSETPRALSWWIPAGVVGAVMAMMLVAGFLRLAARRPGRPAAASHGRDRYAREGASETGPAPTERVRELIRRNPEAAASVLNRWIGQGGHAG